MRIKFSLLLLCIIIPSVFLLSQERLGYDTLKLDYRAYNRLNTCDGCKENYYKFKFYYADGTTEQHDNCFGDFIDKRDSFIKVFPVNNRITRVEWWAHRESKGPFGGCTDDHDAKVGPPHSYAIIDYSSGCFYRNETNPWNGETKESDPLQYPSFVRIETKPALKLFVPDDRTFPTEEPIDLKASYGYSTSVYQWQYSFDNTTWVNFPAQYIGLDSIRLTATELLAGSGLSENSYINRNIFIRINACGGSLSGEIIPFVIRKSAPDISDLAVTPPLCFDTDDGKVKFVFERALLAGESLIMNLRDSTHPGLIYFRQITNDSLDATHAYTFSKNLQPADYYLVYQSRFEMVDGSGATVISQSGIKKSNLFSVVAPTPVAFTTNKVDVGCYGGNDGSIIINATGGTGNYHYMIKRSGEADSLWYPFSGAMQHTITALTTNNYVIQVRDGNNCYAKTAAGGSIISQDVSIIQPASALQNDLVQLINPAGFGSSDGSIEVEVTGGTSQSNGSYNYQWTKLDGTPLNTNITTNVTATGYRIKLSNLADGAYILRVNDNNYSSATAKTGCTDTDTFILKEPSPLKVRIAIQNSILCNGDTNGALITHAEGGVPFSSGNPYTYTWKKRNTAGTYDILPTQSDSIATELTAGWYAVNIKDANGNTLFMDSTFFLAEPAPLQVNINHTDATCTGLPNGSATAVAIGGTPPYSYAWNTGDTTATINNLMVGMYMVFIKDSHGCQTQQNVIISQPNGMVVTMTKQNPVCNNSCNGKLTANLTGGVGPFTYQWKGSTSTTNIASNLCSGIYQVTITDTNGCTVTQQETLVDPKTLPLNLGQDRYICTNQNISYDIAVNLFNITYQWTSDNGFTSNQPNVVLTQPGTYYATITDVNGCNSKDTVVLTKINTVISNEFALPTQAFTNEEIIVVNTSNPAPDSIKWVFPPQATSIQQTFNFAQFIIADTGGYYLQLITYKGFCYTAQTKKIIVAKRTSLNNIGNTRNPFIKLFSVAPNPNNGNFTVTVTLQDKASIQLKLINVLTNETINLVNQAGANDYVIPLNVSVTPGTYVLLLETPKGSQTLKLVIL